MSDDPRIVVFTDLETTTLDPNTGVTLELGMIAVDYATLEVIDRVSYVMFCGQFARAMADPVVVAMHDQSGLWELCAHSRITEQDVQVYACDWMAHITGSRDELVGLAGSGVGTFDSRWLYEHMPYLRARMTYWPLDVGVIRRFCRWAKRDDLLPPDEELPHRALDDADLFFRQAKWFLNLLRLVDLDGANRDQILRDRWAEGSVSL